MLINVNPLISPEILQLIRSIGHGDKFVLAMQIFHRILVNKLYRMDGLSMPEARAFKPFPLTVSFLTQLREWK